MAVPDAEEGPHRLSPSCRVPAPYRTTASFVAAIRGDDEHALRQLFLFYSPLLRDEGRRMGLGAGDRHEIATTVLGDVAIRLQTSDVVPQDLAHYLIAALRNRVRSRVRSANRRDASRERAYAVLESTGELVVAECHSAYGLRSAGEVGAAIMLPTSSAISRLAELSAQSLSDIDARLMVGLGRLIPLRDLAEQAGISYGAARVRVHRLRERMRNLALEHLATLDPSERLELERFLRRAGVLTDHRPGNRPSQRDGSEP